VFVPLLVTRRFDDLNSVVAALLAFLALCLCSSTTGIVGDLMNIDGDRRDPAESANSFGTGELSIFSGLLLVLGLSWGCIASSWLLPRSFWLVLIAYGSLMAMRDLARRRRLNAGMFALAGVYASRLLAGVVAVGLFF
jgi:4-hydroxybenzoate polyprenyltransferase